MRIADMRLLEGIERIPLGDQIERYVTDDSNRASTYQKWVMRDDRLLHPDDESTARRKPARGLVSRYANPKLVLDEHENGDVTITRPDGQRVHVYRRAIEATIRKADAE